MDSNHFDRYSLPLTGLRHFYWAAKLQSFKLAAKSIHVSEAAISQQIRKLEITLGVKLFDRSHQKVTLTHKGEQLFPFVEIAFNKLHEGIENVTKDPEPNKLNLSTFPSFAINWLIKRLTLFYQLHPSISITLDTAIKLRHMDNDNIDLSIRYGAGKYKGLRSELLMEDPMFMICHPSIVSNGVITRDDFLRLPFIASTQDPASHSLQEFKDFHAMPDCAPRETLFLKDGSLGIEAAKSGQGLSLQRLSLVVDLIESGELIYATDFASPTFKLYAVAPEKQFENPKIIKFLAWLKSEIDITSKKMEPHLSKISNLG